MTVAAKQPALRGALVAIGVVAAIAYANSVLAARASRRNPPKGEFVDVDGVKIHYVVMGDGPPVVILHGNGSMAADFLASDLVTMLATSHKVFVFDRPGYGHSDVGLKWWTAARQARCLDGALNRLGVSEEIIMGHSWGTLVALALGQIRACKGLVLLSGYYFASPRLDVFAGAFPATPGPGDLWRWTFGPLVGWLFSVPVFRHLFSPSRVPSRFKARFPLALSLRPKSLKSSAVETLLMVPTAYQLSRSYSHLKVPTVIVAGEKDHIVSSAQAERLCKTLQNAFLVKLSDAGHMLHQTHSTDVLKALKGLEAGLPGAASR